MLIKDPLSQQGARVRKSGRLEVHASTVSQEASAAGLGLSFLASTRLGGNRTLTLATGNSYNLLAIENTSPDKILEISQIIVSVDITGLVLFFTKNPDLSAIGDNVNVEPVNLNFGSTNPAEAEVEIWNEVGTVGLSGITGGEEIASFALGAGPNPVQLNNLTQLHRANSFMIGLFNPTGGAAEAAITARFNFNALDVY